MFHCKYIPDRMDTGRPCVLLKWTVNDWQQDAPVHLYSVLHSTQLNIVVAFTTKTGSDTLFQGIYFFHLSLGL